MSVWIEKAVEDDNWEAIADDDTGDVDAALMVAAHKILYLQELLQDQYNHSCRIQYEEG